MLQGCPIKKKINESTAVPTLPGEKAEEPQNLVPRSRDAALEAEVKALVGSIPGDPDGLQPEVEELASRIQGSTDPQEIEALAEKLPDSVRLQMKELFRAQFTRIQNLDNS
ncbi:MAG: hypothetical protein CMI18_08630 [Opitutaceae bacterium]|nr:hypothetical protein [Opitutaceae bacterium]|tara:strand:- start:382 stop:714 length:333 start_codon:yes stop_codon:yes gene_type:complete